MGKVYKNGIVSPKGFDMAAGEPVDQREIVESLNDLTTMPHCYPGIEVKVVGEQYKEYKLIATPSALIENWIEVVPEYNQPAQQTTDTVLNNSNLPGTTTTDALNSLAFGETGTYDEIKAIRDGNRLTPGNRYIITDYQTKYFIAGSNSSGLKVTNTMSGHFSNSYILFEKGYDYLITLGMVLTIKELPEGYTGVGFVGEQAGVWDIFDNYYFQVGAHASGTTGRNWAADEGMIGAKLSYALDRFDNIPNDTIVNDTNGKPVMRPNGIVNTEVHDGTDYMDQTAAENYTVPTEVIALVAATNNSFEPRAFSGTWLGDQIYYDMDANEVFNDNDEVIDSRPGSIYRRISKDLQFDLPVDWRVQRYRRWLMDEDSRLAFTGDDTVVNAGSPMNDTTQGNMVIGATYVISGIYSNAARNLEAWTQVGAPDGDIGTVFVATATNSTTTHNGTVGWATRIFAAADLEAGEPYDVQIPGDTDFTLLGSSNIIGAEAITIGDVCKIVTVGDTDYTLIGSPDNVVGTIFTATGVGIGTGTVDNGNTKGSRFIATGPGIGTGYATPPNYVRNSRSGFPLYGLYEETVDKIEAYYMVRLPEQVFRKVDRWGQMQTFVIGLEGLAKAKDFYTIPVKSDYEINEVSVGAYIKFDGVWDNVVVNDIDGAVYAIDSEIDGGGIMRNCYFGSGLFLQLDSQCSWTNVTSLDWINSPIGLQGLIMIDVQIVSPLFFSGSSAGSLLTQSIIGGTTRCIETDVSSYTWFVFTSFNSCSVVNCALGNRIAYAGMSNLIMTNCAFFIGGRQTGSTDVNTDATMKRLSMDSSSFEDVVIRFEGSVDRSNLDRINTGRNNPGQPRGQWAWTRTGGIQEKVLYLNQSTHSLLRKEFDEDNIETAIEYIKIDNR